MHIHCFIATGDSNIRTGHSTRKLVKAGIMCKHVKSSQVHRQWTNGRFLGNFERENDTMENDSLIEETLVKMIEDYIDYYNNKRLQRNLGILTPMEKHKFTCKLHKNCQQINFYWQEKFIFFQLST